MDSELVDTERLVWSVRRPAACGDLASPRLRAGCPRRVAASAVGPSAGGPKARARDVACSRPARPVTGIGANASGGATARRVPCSSCRASLEVDACSARQHGRRWRCLLSAGTANRSGVEYDAGVRSGRGARRWTGPAARTLMVCASKASFQRPGPRGKGRFDGTRYRIELPPGIAVAPSPPARSRATRPAQLTRRPGPQPSLFDNPASPPSKSTRPRTTRLPTTPPRSRPDRPSCTNLH